MSLIVDETRGATMSPDRSPSYPQADRNFNRLGTKVKTLRLDSPSTIEACKELGILVQDLKPKTIDDFRDLSSDEEIVKLRFQHFTQRYTQNITDVYAKKRQILRTQQKNTKNRDSQQFDFITDPNRRRSVEKGGGSPRSNLSSACAPSTMKHSSSAALLVPAPIISNYNKTVSYLRKSHETAEVRNLYDIIADDSPNYEADETVEKFDHALALEVGKFNKVKRQKQKEAKDAFEEEVKRIKLTEHLRDKEKRNQEREKRMNSEQKRTTEEKKKRAQEKLEKIRATEVKYQEHKMEEKQKIQKRLENTRIKLAEEMEEKRRMIAGQEERLEFKRRLAEQRRERLKYEEQSRSDQLKVEIQEKLMHSQEKYNVTLSEKMFRVKTQILKIEDSVKKIKDRQEQQAEQHVQNLVQKLVKKEETFKVFHQQHIKEVKRREKSLAEKNRKFMEHQSDINQQYSDRMHEINDRFQKVQDNLEFKKQQEEKDLKLKQELRRLRMLDMQDNYSKKRRQIEYNQHKILEREKYNDEKIGWLKNQKEILQKAKVEASIQSKIEKERISNIVQQLGKVTYEHGTSANLNENQKKLLKEVLQPEDFSKIEYEEKRRHEAKLEAEAQLKLGNIVQISAKQR